MATLSAALPRIDSFRWIKYSYRYYNEESVEQFRQWIVPHKWTEVLRAEGSNAKAENYQTLVDSAIMRFFPLITVRRKTTDLPWVNQKARTWIRRRKAIYRREGRSVAWKMMKKKIDALLAVRKKSTRQARRSASWPTMQ